jgi:hypothetical protein
MELTELLSNSGISIRAYNVCIGNGYNEINELVNYYTANQTFKKFRNCGEKTNQELIEICKQHSNKKDSIHLLSLYLSIDVYSLSRIKRQIINDVILIGTSNLTNRSKNAMIILLDGNFTIHSLIEKVYSQKNFQLSDLRNVGELTINELSIYLTSIKNFIIDVIQLNDDEHLEILKIDSYLKKVLNIDQIPNYILNSPTAFVLSQFLISNGLLFSGNKKIIFESLFNIYIVPPTADLTELAKALRLSRERVRQIRNEILSEISNKFSVLGALGETLIKNFKIDIRQDYIFISNSMVENINTISNTKFSKQFIIFILSHVLMNSHHIVGDLEDVLFLKSQTAKNRHNWKNLYLINNTIKATDNIKRLIDDISYRISERIDETYKFNLTSYVNKFFGFDDSNKLLKISVCCEQIINEELNIYMDIQDNIVFQRNTIKSLPEYIIELLDELGEPTKINKMYNILIQRFPNITKSASALRGTCNRIEEIIYFGRSSTYGLAKWESKDSIIKGGTIKDMVFEFLKSKANPIHIFEIFQYVSKYRKTTSISILSNLTIDPNKVFKFYNYNFIGIKELTHSYNEEKYSNLPIHLGKKIIGIIQRKQIENLSDLEIFLNHNYQLDKDETKSIILQLQQINKSINII